MEQTAPLCVSSRQLQILHKYIYPELHRTFCSFTSSHFTILTNLSASPNPQPAQQTQKPRHHSTMDHNSQSAQLIADGMNSNGRDRHVVIEGGESSLDEVEFNFSGLDFEWMATGDDTGPMDWPVSSELSDPQTFQASNMPNAGNNAIDRGNISPSNRFTTLMLASLHNS